MERFVELWEFLRGGGSICVGTPIVEHGNYAEQVARLCAATGTKPDDRIVMIAAATRGFAERVFPGSEAIELDVLGASRVPHGMVYRKASGNEILHTPGSSPWITSTGADMLESIPSGTTKKVVVACCSLPYSVLAMLHVVLNNHGLQRDSRTVDLLFGHEFEPGQWTQCGIKDGRAWAALV